MFMRWFKHVTTAAQDQKIMAVIQESGVEGYGIYFMLLEIVGRQLDKKNEVSLKYSAKLWANSLYISAQKVRRNFKLFAEKDLIKLEVSQIKNQFFYRVEIPNLLKYRDEFTRRGEKSPESLPINSRSESGVITDSLAGARVQSSEVQILNTEHKGDQCSVGSGLPCDDPVLQLIADYHQFVPSAKAVDFNFAKNHPSLKSKIKNVTENIPRDDWVALFKKAEASAFLTGRKTAPDGRHFKGLSLGWLLSPKIIEAVMSGRYKDRTADMAQGGIDGWYENQTAVEGEVVNG